MLVPVLVPVQHAPSFTTWMDGWVMVLTSFFYHSCIERRIRNRLKID